MLSAIDTGRNFSRHPEGCLSRGQSRYQSMKKSSQLTSIDNNNKYCHLNWNHSTSFYRVAVFLFDFSFVVWLSAFAILNHLAITTIGSISPRILDDVLMPRFISFVSEISPLRISLTRRLTETPIRCTTGMDVMAKSFNSCGKVKTVYAWFNALYQVQNALNKSVNGILWGGGACV